MKEVFLTDLTKYISPESYSTQSLPYRWRAISYRTEEREGTMLYAPPGSNAPELKIRPELSGWYIVRVGMWSPSRELPAAFLRARLTGDRGWSQLRVAQIKERGKFIDEVFWRCAELTPETEFRFAMFGYYEPPQATIAWLRFIPMDAAQIAQVKADREDNSENMRLLGTHDMHYLFCVKDPTVAENLYEEIEVYRESDFEVLHYEFLTGGPDLEDELSELSWEFGRIGDVFHRSGDYYYRLSMEKLRAENARLQLYKDLVDLTHSMGRRMYMSFRTQAFSVDPPYDDGFTTKFFDRNPQWRCVAQDGSQISRMSYAYEGVQDRLIRNYLYMLQTGCDGVSVLFNRCFPFVMYEEPAAERFAAKYGVPGHEVAFDDPRWCELRAEIVTEYLRKLRAALDKAAEEMGRERIALSIHMLLDKETNFLYGLDGRTLAVEGIVDDIVAHPITDNLQGRYLSYCEFTDEDLQYYADMVKGTNVRLYCDMFPRVMSVEEYRTKAARAYAHGFYGLAFWDSYSRHFRRSEWGCVSRLGHRDELNEEFPEWRAERSERLVEVSGHRVMYWQPIWAL